MEAESTHSHCQLRLMVKVQGTDIDELPLHVTVSPKSVEAGLRYSESGIACMITLDACVFGVWASEAQRDEHTVQEPCSKDKVLIQTPRRRIMERNLPLKEMFSRSEKKAMGHLEFRPS